MNLPVARALPVFWQMTLLLVTSLLIAQLVGFAMLVIAPPPRPDFNRLSDVVAALAPGSAAALARDRDSDDRERRLVVTRVGAPPPARPRMVHDAAFVDALAERLRVPPADVRLYFEPDRPGSLDRRGRSRRPVSIRDGEPLFFTPIVAGVRTPAGWRVAATPPLPWIAPWQRRMMTWLGASVIVLLPVVWLFARAITRPIRRFADAADRLGADPQAPAVREEGPAELRTTARALNRMQARLADYVGERTAMIGAIAHDLRTPLARIAFRIESAPEPLRDKVMGDVEQMRAMLAATIGFVRNTDAAGERVPLDLTALLRAIVAQDRDLGREVTAGYMEEIAILADPLALERLFQNLIGNGLAYAGAVDVSLRRLAAIVEVVIADRGPGMPAELLERAFQPFVRGDPSRNRATGGIGLGLTIARAICENHGGTLTLTNRAGGGLIATCRLPLTV